MTKEEIVMKFVDIDNNKEEIVEKGISFAVMMGDGNGGVITSAGDPDEILEMLVKALVCLYENSEDIKDGTILDFAKMVGATIIGEHFIRHMKKGSD